VQFNLDERPSEAPLEPTADAVMLRVEISPIARGRLRPRRRSPSARLAAPVNIRKLDPMKAALHPPPVTAWLRTFS